MQERQWVLAVADYLLHNPGANMGEAIRRVSQVWRVPRSLIEECVELAS